MGIWRAVRGALAATAVVGGLAAVAPACLNRPIEPVEPRTTSTIVDRLTQSSVDKIDILLMIDNSGSMADKQDVLKVAVPKLIEALVNPKCVDEKGKPSPAQPKGPLEGCPVQGTKREFDPIVNMHVGVMTSSLGGHGADSCLGNMIPSENDNGKLTSRGSTDGSIPNVATWDQKGFLVWDPDTKKPTHKPQGDIDLIKFTDNLGKLVFGTGEVGCGFESQLEAWYRFAVVPDPYKTIQVVNNNAELKDVDKDLLKQRADFLRPDSLFAIIMLTDENDCSVRDGSQYFFALQRYTPGGTTQYHLPKARAACQTDPNSACCRSCGQGAGDGCDQAQDKCDENKDGKPDPLKAEEDTINTRCFDQKRRFGIDFLQPIQRYVDGLTRQTVQDRMGNMVPNPLFTDLNPSDSNNNIRDASLVFVAGIVGVPWQDIARKNAGADGKLGTADDKPDLINGIDATDQEQVTGKKQPAGGFQSGDELAQNKVWDVILGDPTCDVKNPMCRPTDPLMIETIDQRTGKNPVTGDNLQPSTAGELANPINGHEWDIKQRDDLQYACIFELPKPLDCSLVPMEKNCDCRDANNVNKKPLCDPAKPTVQKYAKGYPGRRELQLLKAMSSNGIVGSICPAQLKDSGKADYGYTPAVGAIIERLKKSLQGKCLPRSLTPDNNGQVGCFILEAKIANQCACDPAQARKDIPPGADGKEHPAITAAKLDPAYNAAKWNCFCEIKQTQGAPGKNGRPKDLDACQNNPPGTDLTMKNEDGQAVDGWCYIDATTVPPTGNVDVVADCPASEKRKIRFVGKGQGATGATLFVTCSGE
jgi:hypothetical protein